MKLPPLISVPLSWLYGMVVHIRHKLFDLKILRSEEFDIPVVCIGNLTVGGTGKTPVAELLRCWNIAGSGCCRGDIAAGRKDSYCLRPRRPHGRSATSPAR